MATSKKPPKKKLPTGPTKGDLLSRMGVNKQPEPIKPAPTLVEDSPHPPESDVAPVEVEPISAVPAFAESLQEPIPIPVLAAASISEDPLPDADPWPEPPPDPVEVEEMASPALSPQIHRAEWTRPAVRVVATQRLSDSGTESLLLSPTSARLNNSNGNGVHKSTHPRQTLQLDPLPPPSTPVMPDPREALDAQLGLQKLTLKCSADMLEKLGSLQNSTGLPGEILVEVLVDHWEQLPKSVQQDCLMQAHRIRVERLVISQNHTIATIEQLLNEQNLS
ncbi:MAG: hypothetical protein Q6L68_04315 [Thermostichus sp. DG02_5_bins_236]